MHTSRSPIKKLLLGLCAILVVAMAFTVYANIRVENSAIGRTYASVDSIPHNRVALLLGTNPLNRRGRPNTYFTNRINTAVQLLGEKIVIPDIAR